MRPEQFSLIVHDHYFTNEYSGLRHTVWRHAIVDSTPPHPLTSPLGLTHLVRGVRLDTARPEFQEAISDCKEMHQSALRLPLWRHRKPASTAFPRIYYYRGQTQGRDAVHYAGVCMPQQYQLTATSVVPLDTKHKAYGTLLYATATLNEARDPIVTITATAPLSKHVKQARQFLMLRNCLLEQIVDTPLEDYV